MTDVGTYAAVEGELITLITTPAITGLLSIERTTGLHGFLARQAKRKPCVGVAWASSKRDENYDLTSVRTHQVLAQFEIFAIAASGRGASSVGTGAATEALPLLTLIETIHDRLERVRSAQSPRDGFYFLGETRMELEEDQGILAGVTLTYGLRLMMAKGAP